MITQSRLTGLWVASRLDAQGNVTEERDFSCKYSALEWLNQ